MGLSTRLRMPFYLIPGDLLFLSPLMIPHVVLGIAFLRFFTQIGLGGTFAGSPLGCAVRAWV